MTPILPSENRSVLQSLEKSENIPDGLLQGLNEKMTGWRTNLNFLPKFMLPENERGDNKTEQEVMAQDVTGAKFMRSNLDLFDGNETLASHAFLFGPEKTKKRLEQGRFPQNEADSVFDVAKRKTGILGQEITADDINRFASMLGTKPSNKVIKQKQPPRPEPQKPVSLKRRENGKYYTGDPLYDSIMYIESKGDTNAVSKTGATGLFQFTRRTGKQYGLFKGGDHRSNPEANFRAMKALTRDNSKTLANAGIPVNPTTIYLSHQLGAGGMKQLWGEMTGKSKISGQTKKDMNHNWGAKSAKEYFAQAQRKVQEALKVTGHADYQAGGNVDINTSQLQAQDATTQPQEAQQPQQAAAPETPEYAKLDEDKYRLKADATQVESTDPAITQTSTAINPLQASSTDNATGIAKPSLMDSTVQITKRDWSRIADEVFSTQSRKHNPKKNISRAIGGLIKGIV